VVSFLFLFLSPLLTESAAWKGWWALALGRAVAAGGLLYAQPTLLRWRERLLVLLRSAVFGVPFWFSSFFSPLRSDQVLFVEQSALVYIVVLGLVGLLSTLSTHWFPALVGALTFLALDYPWRPDWYWSLLLFALLPLMWPRRVGWSGSLEFGSRRVLVALGAGGWAFALFLEVNAVRPDEVIFARVMLAWFLVAGVSTLFLPEARWEWSTMPLFREVELSVPGLREASDWLYGKRLVREFGPWLCLAPLLAGSPAALPIILVVLFFCLALVFMASREMTSSVQLQRLCAVWFVILWGVGQVQDPWRYGWVALALMVAWLPKFVRDGSSKRASLERALFSNPSLESRLTLNLRHSAPPHAGKEIMSKLEPSVDFDKTLSAQAPQGFRQRLLERLRKSEAEGD